MKSRTRQHRENPLKKIKRNAMLPGRIMGNKPKQRIRTLKPYTAQNNPAKMDVNAVFASNIVNFLGVDKKVIVLDSEHGITCKTLIAAGVQPWLITPANINLHICRKLFKEYSVRDYHGHIEDGVAITRFDAAWYDGMTNMNGRIDLDTYIGVFAHRFLKTNRGRRCIMAITVNTESNNTDCNYLPQKEVFTRQISALIAYHGFIITEVPILSDYKPNHIFGMWNLIPSTTVVPRLKFLTHLGKSRLIGFPHGFTEKHL